MLNAIHTMSTKMLQWLCKDNYYDGVNKHQYTWADSIHAVSAHPLLPSIISFFHHSGHLSSHPHPYNILDNRVGSMCKNLEILFMGSFVCYLTYVRPHLSKPTKNEAAPQGKTSQGGMWPQYRQEEQWPPWPGHNPQALQGWRPCELLSTDWVR